MRTAVSKSRRTSGTPREEVFHLVVGHGLPPVWVEDLNLAPQRTQRALLAGRLFGAHDFHHWHTPAADDYRFPILDCPDQFRQLVFGIGHADQHGMIIAI